MEFSTGKIAHNYYVCIYGPPGVGKSTLCVSADRSLFLDFEGGTLNLDANRVSNFETIEQIFDLLKTIVEGNELNSKFNTLVIDTIEIVEKMIFDFVAARHGKKSISDIPYGKGHDEAAELMFQFLNLLSEVRNSGKNVIILAHEAIRKYESPISGTYDRYVPKLHHKSLSYLHAKVDGVFFMSRDIVVSDGKAFTKNGRKIFTEETAHLIAKSRYDLPSEIIIRNEDDALKFFNLLV